MSALTSRHKVSIRDQRGLRLALIALPFLTAFPVLLSNEVSPGEVFRYLLWTAGWWVVGSGLTTILPIKRHRMSIATFGGILGVIAQLVAWALAVTAGHASYVLPALLTVSLIGVLVSKRSRHQIRALVRPAPPSPGTESGATVPTYVLGAWSLMSLWLLAHAQAFFRDNSFSPHRGAAMQDLFWHLGIAAQLKNHVIPPVSESDTGTYLNYHWLSDAFMASGSLGAHVSTVMVSERLWLIPTLLLACALIVVVTLHITGTYTSVIPALLVVSTSTTLPILPWQGLGPSTTFLLSSPSQIFGIPMTLFALMLITRYWRGRLSWRAALALIVVLVLCTGSKSSIVPVFIGGMTLTLLVSGLLAPSHRRNVRAVGIRILMCAVIAEIIALPVFAGGSAGSQIRLVGHLRHWGVLAQLTGHPHGVGHGPFMPPGLSFLTACVVALLVILLVASYGVGILSAALGTTTWRSDPIPMFLTFSLFSAIAAFCLIDHTGESESYFPMGAMPFLAVLSGWGFSAIWKREAQNHHRTQSVYQGVLIAIMVTAIIQWAPHTLPSHANLLIWLGFPVLAWVVAAVFGWRLAHSGHAVLVSTALIGVGVCWPAWTSLRATVPDLTRPAPKALSSSVYANEQEALRWIRDHTPANALVATNVHCHDVAREPHCDSSAYWTNALAERRFFVGSWGYTDGAQRNAGVDGFSAIQQEYPDHTAFTLNEAMFYTPSADVARQLRHKGVTWLFADDRVALTSPTIGVFAHLVGTWGSVKVYKLTG